MRLIDEIRAALDRATTTADLAAERRATLDQVRASLDAPLKVAVAGRVKAGKSTLVNALVGDEIAPTDAGECTRIVTWYRDGLTYRVEALRDGTRSPLRFTRDGGALHIDLGGLGADGIDRLEVEWPTAALRDQTIIDTPGIDSIDAANSARAVEFLTPEDERVTEADAVLYLMRHAHRSDVAFLEAFHDEEVAKAAPLNSIGILSRADEIGVGRLDAMDSARRIARNYATDPKIRRLCATVVPVAGLLAEAAAGLREAEYRAFVSLADLPDDVLDPLLWSADRFVDPTGTDVLIGEERAHLIERFGLFGIRVAIDRIRSGRGATASELSQALLAESGIGELRAVLHRSFTARRDLLVARSALLRLEQLATADPALGPLATDLERIRAGAHELTETRYLNLLRSGNVALPAARCAELERLFGADGDDARARLGLDASCPDSEVRDALLDALARNQKRAESSAAGQEARELARAAVRTCEGLLAAAAQPEPA